MTIDEFDHALTPYPTYHIIFTGYKNKKLGAKTICNMMGISVPAVAALRPEHMDRCIAMIGGAGTPEEDESSQAKCANSIIKPGKKIEINEKDYKSYGSW